MVQVGAAVIRVTVSAAMRRLEHASR